MTTGFVEDTTVFEMSLASGWHCKSVLSCRVHNAVPVMTPLYQYSIRWPWKKRLAHQSQELTSPAASTMIHKSITNCIRLILQRPRMASVGPCVILELAATTRSIQIALSIMLSVRMAPVSTSLSCVSLNIRRKFPPILTARYVHANPIAANDLGSSRKKKSCARQPPSPRDRSRHRYRRAST
eukprot:3213779-Prymnesium_polylepis.1